MDKLQEDIERTIQTLQGVQRKISECGKYPRVVRGYLAERWLVSNNSIERDTVYRVLLELEKEDTNGRTCV